MTTSSEAAVASRSAAAARPPAGAGIAIAVIAGAQLMVALDVTIVNIALPHIETALHFSRPSLAWVIDAYTLVFGGLMLLGGRAADFLGRKRMFIAGLGLMSRICPASSGARPLPSPRGPPVTPPASAPRPKRA